MPDAGAPGPDASLPFFEDAGASDASDAGPSEDEKIVGPGRLNGRLGVAAALVDQEVLFLADPYTFAGDEQRWLYADSETGPGSVIMAFPNELGTHHCSDARLGSDGEPLVEFVITLDGPGYGTSLAQGEQWPGTDCTISVLSVSEAGTEGTFSANMVDETGGSVLVSEGAFAATPL